MPQAVSIPVIASGGLASMADIETPRRAALRRLGGAIAGRALYDGRIDAARALAMLSERAARAGGSAQTQADAAA